jgi:hypothetical protein
MAQKTIKTKKFTHQQQSKSEDIDVSQPGLIHIDNEPYFVDGVVAKFILELLDEVDSYKQQLDMLESYIGEYGKS